MQYPEHGTDTARASQPHGHHGPEGATGARAEPCTVDTPPYRGLYAPAPGPPRRPARPAATSHTVNVASITRRRSRRAERLGHLYAIALSVRLPLSSVRCCPPAPPVPDGPRPRQNLTPRAAAAARRGTAPGTSVTQATAGRRRWR